MGQEKLNIDRNEKLWLEFISGDDTAFARLYELNVDSMLYYGLHYTPIRELVKDAIQDVFVALYSHRSGLRKVDNVKLYLFVSLKQIPRRLVYPSREYTINKANIEKAIARQGADDLNTRVWWDK